MNVTTTRNDSGRHFRHDTGQFRVRTKCRWLLRIALSILPVAILFIAGFQPVNAIEDPADLSDQYTLFDQNKVNPSNIQNWDQPTLRARFVDLVHSAYAFRPQVIDGDVIRTPKTTVVNDTTYNWYEIKARYKDSGVYYKAKFGVYADPALYNTGGGYYGWFADREVDDTPELPLGSIGYISAAMSVVFGAFRKRRYRH